MAEANPRPDSPLTDPDRAARRRALLSQRVPADLASPAARRARILGAATEAALLRQGLDVLTTASQRGAVGHMATAAALHASRAQHDMWQGEEE